MQLLFSELELNAYGRQHGLNSSPLPGRVLLLVSTTATVASRATKWKRTRLDLPARCKMRD
ncbi:hypothetical protein PLICRDRAFT_44040, partial [Plicaturopsis crispa FD-325 SS-3]